MLGDGGVGEVMDVSILREQITLEFDYLTGYKEVSFSNAFRTLIPISKEHFLARRFGDLEHFEILVKEKPLETIRILLRDLGPKTAIEIKDELCGFVILEKDWAKWWQSARSKIKKDTLIEFPKKQKDPFRLRTEDVSHEEQLKKRLSSFLTVQHSTEVIYSFVKNFPESLRNSSFKKYLIDYLVDLLEKKEITDSQEIQILLLLQDLGHEKVKDLTNLITKYSDMQKILSEIFVISYKKRILVEVEKSRSDWATIFAESILTIDQNPLRDYLLKELLNQKKELLIKEKISQFIHSPTISPSAFLWYFQKVMTSKNFEFSDQVEKSRLFEAFFILLYELESLSSSKDFIKKNA